MSIYAVVEPFTMSTIQTIAPSMGKQCFKYTGRGYCPSENYDFEPCKCNGPLIKIEDSYAVIITSTGACVRLNNDKNKPLYKLIDPLEPHKGFKLSYKGEDYDKECEVKFEKKCKKNEI